MCHSGEAAAMRDGLIFALVDVAAHAYDPDMSRADKATALAFESVTV
jgi:hypothetical protein